MQHSTACLTTGGVPCCHLDDATRQVGALDGDLRVVGGPQVHLTVELWEGPLVAIRWEGLVALVASVRSGMNGRNQGAATTVSVGRGGVIVCACNKCSTILAQPRWRHLGVQIVRVQSHECK